MQIANTETNIELVRKFIEFYNSFEIKKMVNLFSENCIFQNISNLNGFVECRGKDELYKMANQSAIFFLKDAKQLADYS